MSSLDQCYFLLHAYDLLGEHLYGKDWTAQELKQPRLEPPAATEEQRAPFETQIAQINARDDEIGAALKRETKDEFVAALMRERKELFAARAQLQATLHSLPTPNEDYRRSYAAYERAEKTTAVLMEALENRAIQAIAATGLVIDWPTWSATPGFRCYLPLSLVVMPRSISGIRRAAVLIRQQEFNAWLQDVPPLTPDRVDQLPAEAKCRAWLSALVQTNPLVRPQRKEVLRDEAIRLFGISARGFDRLWETLVPKTWKQSGSPKGPRKIVAPGPKGAR